ncbi:MAG: hypothetical protein Q8R92_15775 [Deltaproteobacteria bacterium]|nr:hypothetical protein [Deltaproteobacteria bacterium]
MAEHRTQEQMAVAKELATAARGYRVVADAEGWPVSPGRYGRLEHLGALPGHAPQLAAFTTSRRLWRRLLALDGVTKHQTGDAEFRGLVAPAAVPAVARLLRCRCRKVISEAQAASLAVARTSTQFKASIL